MEDKVTLLSTPNNFIMTSIPSKLGLIILALYWSVMTGLTIHALTTDKPSIDTSLNTSVTQT